LSHWHSEEVRCVNGRANEQSTENAEKANDVELRKLQGRGGGEDARKGNDEQSAGHDNGRHDNVGQDN